MCSAVAVDSYTGNLRGTAQGAGVVVSRGVIVTHKRAGGMDG